MSQLGVNVRALRERIGWSQAELSRRSGVPQSAINDLESGKQKELRSDNLKRVAEALEVSVDALLTGEVVARPPLPTADMPPALRAIIERLGQYLDDASWERLAGYAEALAEDRRRMGLPAPPPSAYGYHVPDTKQGAEESTEDPPAKVS
jgi:transcriptional regulator with XRE-family HTH domain